jgi:hypothetical protein
LVLLIVATAVLFAWLLVVLGRLTLGDTHLPLPHPSPVQPRATSADAPGAPSSLLESPTGSAGPPPGSVVHDDPDAERVVREHLYGRRT